MKIKAVEARLGNPDELPGVAETKATIADLLKGVLGRHLAGAEAEYQARRLPIQQKHARLRQTQRATSEAQLRAARFRRGWRGLWDRLVGRHAQLKRENELEVAAETSRDVAEREALIQSQLQERRPLKVEMSAVRRAFEAELTEVYRELTEIDQTIGDTRLDETTDQVAGPRRRDRRGPEP